MHSVADLMPQGSEEIHERADRLSESADEHRRRVSAAAPITDGKANGLGCLECHPHRTPEKVDFLLRRGREFLAVEVKAQPRFSTPQLAGLRAIAELPRLARRILVYLGERQLRTEDGIDVWPLDRFTAAAADGSLWP